MTSNGFIHSQLNFEYGIAGKVEDILPKLQAAAAKYSEAEEEGLPNVIKKM